MYLGIEIGGTKLQMVLGEGGRIEHRWRASVRTELGAAGIREQLRAGIIEMSGRGRPRAVGVGFGGPVDTRTGRICKSHQIGGWDDFPLRDWLSELTGATVVVDNDANVGGFGEATHGAGVGADPVLWVNFGSGVGGGLVLGGRIYHGRPPGEVEFGHLLLDRDGTIVESRCSGWAIDQRIRKLCSEATEGTMARLIGASAGGEARHLPAALAQGDAIAERIVREFGADVAFALSHTIHLLHPQVIVMGGGLSNVGEPLRRAVSDQLPRFVMKAFLPAPEVRLAALGEDAVPVGAMELAARL